MSAAQQVVSVLLETDNRARRLVRAGLPRADATRKIKAAVERMGYQFVAIRRAPGLDATGGQIDRLILEFGVRPEHYSSTLHDPVVRDGIKNRLLNALSLVGVKADSIGPVIIGVSGNLYTAFTVQ